MLGLLPSAEQPPQIIGPLLGRRPRPLVQRRREEDEALLIALGII